jgi:hypothetical protein
MKYRGKYSLKKTLLNEAALTGEQVFNPKYDRPSIFIDKLDNKGTFVLNADQTTTVTIAKDATGYNNKKLYDALKASSQDGYNSAFGNPGVLAIDSSGDDVILTGGGKLFKNADFGGGSSRAQSVGTQYEEDAASYFKSILQKNLQAELQGGSAGASDIGSDNEYYIGTSRDDLAGGTNILKAEVKTSPGATYGQAQWRFKIDPKTFMPTEFYYQKGKKHFTKDTDGKSTAEISPTGKLLDQLNDPIKTQLNSGVAQLQKSMAAIAENEKGWYKNYKTAAQGEKASLANAQGKTIEVPVEVSGFKGGKGGRNKVTQLIFDHIKASFKAVSDTIKGDVGNAGYTYYKAKGDQFIIVGKGYGIYSLDQPETSELAKALKIPSFKDAGNTDISFRTGGARLMNMPKVDFASEDVKGAAFPGTIQDLAAAVEVGGDMGRVAIGFALFIQGSLEGLGASQITGMIDAAEIVLGASDTEAVEDIIANTGISKEDVLGNPQAEGDEPGTQQENSKQYAGISRLFEWAVK